MNDSRRHLASGQTDKAEHSTWVYASLDGSWRVAMSLIWSCFSLSTFNSLIGPASRCLISEDITVCSEEEKVPFWQSKRKGNP